MPESRSILKYPLAITDHQQLCFAKDYQILSVINQDGNLVLYVLAHKPDQAHPASELVDILIAGTGNPIPDLTPKHTFLGTVSIPPFVWHIYYKDRSVVISGSGTVSISQNKFI